MSGEVSASNSEVLASHLTFSSSRSTFTELWTRFSTSISLIKGACPWAAKHVLGASELSQYANSRLVKPCTWPQSLLCPLRTQRQSFTERPRSLFNARGSRFMLLLKKFRILYSSILLPVFNLVSREFAYLTFVHPI